MIRRLSARRAGLAAACVLPALFAACSSGSGSGSGSGPSTGVTTQSSNGQLQRAGSKVLDQMHTYTSAAAACTKATSPVVCVETADRTLGNQIHDYANLLAVGRGFTAPAADLSAARNASQTLANSLEILGDAQPTQSNYNQVLNTYNIGSAISQLEADVSKVDGDVG